MIDPRWRDRAACKGKTPALWFPTLDDPDNHGQHAKTICATCPVREQCLIDAVSTRQMHGILGGAGEKQRRPLRRAWLEGGIRWTMTVAAHWKRLAGDRLDVFEAGLLDANGDRATHGLPGSYSKGCRCSACTMAASMRGADAKVQRRHKVAAATWSRLSRLSWSATRFSGRPSASSA